MEDLVSRRELIRIGSALTALAIPANANAQQATGSQLPFVVCFEVQPTLEGLDRYLATAKSLLPELERIPGFISIERSRDPFHARRLLSLSYWADEAALVAWRVHSAHHEAQLLGRNELFADYRLRVGQVVTAQGRTSYNRPPYHRRQYLGIVEVETEGSARDAHAVQNSLGLNNPDLHLEWRAYQSMVHSDRLFFVATIGDENVGRLLGKALGGSANRARLQLCEVERDYGRFQREQAPQHFPPIAGTERAKRD